MNARYVKDSLNESKKRKTSKKRNLNEANFDHPYVGRRVELESISDPYTDLKPGEQGTVEFVDDKGTIFVKWDNGSGLGLIPGIDDFRFID